MESCKNQVEAVLFDLGGTLVAISNDQIPHVMKKILKNCGISRSLEEITSAWKEAEKGLDFRDLTRLLDDFWVEWNERILSRLHVESNSRALARFIATHWWDYSDVGLYSDAERILPLLKERGLKIGLISNGLQSDINEILPKAGLQNYFDIVVVIDTLRKMKPDVEVFHYALQKLKTAPSNAIFIGDRVEEDYKGARGAGLRAYLIDRDCKVQDESVNKISSLDDLFKLNILK